MNLLESVVVDVLGPPKFHSWDDGAVTCWTVPVRADCYGHLYDTEVLAQTEEEARKVKEGHVWLT